MDLTARLVRVRGVVQGVGFRPYIYRLAQAHQLNGWVLNAGDAVEIHVEGSDAKVATFLADVGQDPPPAASILGVDVMPDASTQVADFTIRESRQATACSAHISPDLPVCARCLAELRDSTDRRYGYPYINCTDCGPRYSIIEGVPYDRAMTTMHAWPMCAACAAEYHDPGSRRFHAQPNACPACGPHYRGHDATHLVAPLLSAGRRDVLAAAAAALRDGAILAIKGIGGYHLACDARNADAVAALRLRKFRKEKPFAIMVPDIERARELATLSVRAATLLRSPARPVVLVSSRVTLEGVAPGNSELGVMLPYTPLHHLLFDRGAPSALVMTSANRSSEPIAFTDNDALRRLDGIADAFVVGERPIARRMDDSVVRAHGATTMVLRRSRGYAPSVVATIPSTRPILALGGDLKNSVTLVAGGEAFTSQHLGDLQHFDAFTAFRETIDDLLTMHGVNRRELLVVADCHPQYRSSGHALALGGAEVRLVQHHRAHVASVLAERGELGRPVIGIACDGTGYGDDGSIWGGEFFAGSVASGFARVGHLHTARLPGGDAAAEFPVQAVAGFLAQLEGMPSLEQEPFAFPRRYAQALRLLQGEARVFRTTSLGRLFDAAAALAGFHGAVSFEGQAAIWLEQLAQRAPQADWYPFPFNGTELDYRPLLTELIRDRVAGRAPAVIARAFHRGVARGIVTAAAALAQRHGVDVVVASGGVFQNMLLLDEVESLLADAGLTLWGNSVVPANDGGLSLGQAALAASGHGEVSGA